MGGKGSTRWGSRGDYIAPLTIREATEIRSSRLFGEIRPQLGRSLVGRLECSEGGPLDFTIDGTSWPVTVFLRFSERVRAAGFWVPDDTSLWLLPTEPTYGGTRWWFLCPACGRRCTAVYLLPRGYSRSHGLPWACRTCQGLVYPSQREGQGDRALRRLRKVLARCEAWYDDWLPRRRPRGMHGRTFQRLSAEAYRGLVMASLAGKRTAWKLRETGPFG